MSRKSNDQGRAYEFACLNILYEEITKIRPAEIEKNSSYFAAEKAWNTLNKSEMALYRTSALAGVMTIFDLEPLILEDGKDMLELKIQPDGHGEDGDVRDVLIIRRGIKWEIGLSVKHNHFAVKHSRLSNKIDFGDKWYGVKCSEAYWNDISPIFEFLEAEKAKSSYWRDMPDKAEKVYIPLLIAFRDEITRQNQNKDLKIPKRMVEYLLGQFDFYKVIGIDSKRITTVQSYNLRGTLNKPIKNKKRNIVIPISELPTRIVSFDFKPGSNNTLELYMDGGWQFSFRIHNASSRVEAIFKFYIQIVGMPATIISIYCKWK